MTNRKQPKIINAVYSRNGKLIGINGYIDREENRIIFEELPKKETIQANLDRVDYILNMSDVTKPSSYYRLNY